MIQDKGSMGFHTPSKELNDVFANIQEELFKKKTDWESLNQTLTNVLNDVQRTIGPDKLCKVAAENLSEGGCIINISSIAGKRGSANNSVYCVSKFGVNGLTQALAKELGPKGIRVNAVCPVYIQTKGLMEALGNKRSPTQGKDIDLYLKIFAAENAALKRLPTGDEVAKMCLFLASDKASAITGQCIHVDCGVLPQ